MSDWETRMDDAMYDNAYESEAQKAHEDLYEDIIDDFVTDTTVSYFDQNKDMLAISYIARDEANKVIAISPSSAILFTYTAIETAIKHTILKPMIFGMTHNENVANLLVDKYMKEHNVARYTDITFNLVDTLIQFKLDSEQKAIIGEIKGLAKQRNGVTHRGELYTKKDALDALNILNDLYDKVIMKMLNHINFTIKDEKVCRQTT